MQEHLDLRKDMWANGNLMSDNSTALIANNALAQGFCNACSYVLNLDHETILEKADNGK